MAPVWSCSTAGVDEVVRTINIRNEPENYRVDNLLSYGLPFGYTLNFWRHTDLTTAAGDDREKLVQMALFSDDERRSRSAPCCAPRW